MVLGRNGRAGAVDYPRDEWELGPPRAVLSGQQNPGHRYGRTVDLYDVATGNKRASLHGHRGGISSLAFSPDGKTLASGSGDRTVRVWDLASGQERNQFPYLSPTHSVSFSDDGKLLAAGSDDGMVKVWEPGSAEAPDTLKHGGAVKSVVFSRDGQTLIAGGDHPTKLWDVAAGKEKGTLPGPIWSAPMSQDGKTREDSTVPGMWSGAISQDVSGGTLEVRQSTISGNTAVGGSNPSSESAVGEGGGLFIASVAYLDTFTVDHTINNYPDDIVGTYFLYAAPRLAIGDVTVLEGNTGTRAATFTVTLSGASDQPVTVDYATSDGTATAGSDYVAAAGTLTIPAGQLTGTITVLVNGDRLGEPSETFVVNLSSPTNSTIVASQGVGNIMDDEPLLSIGDMSKKEGNSGLMAFAFTVSLSAPYDVPVTIGYSTANGSAMAGSDYQAATGTLTIPAGQMTGTITIQAVGDRLPEPDETFYANLSNSNYGGVVDGQGVGTIFDDEPRISISDVTKAEGKKGQITLFTFTVTLSAAYDQAVTMSYRTVNGIATTSDSDYVAKTGSLTFAPGETTKTISIEVKGDSKKEGNETFYLDLFGNSSNSLFTKYRGIGTILNDD